MPDIPETAVQAAAEVLFRDYESQYEADHLTWRDFADLARATLEAAAPVILAAIPVTDEMVDRACHALWWNADIPCSQPYNAKAGNYVRMLDEYTDEEKLPGGLRSQDLERLQAADREAEQMSREVMRRTLEAALSPPVAQEDEDRGH